MSTPAPPDAVADRPTSGGLPPVTGNCPNCGAAMVGPFCYVCGQPKKGLIRHFSTIIGDFVDTVFNLDNRLWRTLAPLFFKPGYLTNEYLDGKRARYVTPLRLYFFLSVIAFIVIGSLSGDDWVDVGGNARGNARELAALSPEQREVRLKEIGDALKITPGVRDEVLKELREELQREDAERAADVKLREERRQARAAREARRAAERAARGDPPVKPSESPPAPSPPRKPGEEPAAPPAPDAPADTAATADTGKPRAARVTIEPDPSLAQVGAMPPDAEPDDAGDDDGDGEVNLNFNGRRWDRDTNPLVFSWLPAFANAAMNDEIGVIAVKLKDIRRDPRPFIRQMFESAPQALFVILPVFALLLKLFYVFKRRLYMEHLIVALHSHSFLCFAIICIGALEFARARLSPGIGSGVLAWTVGFIWAWMPIYLLIMQKRVYRQGWIMTFLKYCMIGTAYIVLLSFGMVLTLLLSLILL